MALKCNIANPAFGDNVVFVNAYIRVKDFNVQGVTTVQTTDNVLEVDGTGTPVSSKQVPATDDAGNILFTSTHVVRGVAFAYADRNARALEKAPVAVVNFQFDLPADQSGNIVEWIYTQLKTQPEFINAADV